MTPIATLLWPLISLGHSEVRRSRP